MGKVANDKNDLQMTVQHPVCLFAHPARIPRRFSFTVFSRRSDYTKRSARTLLLHIPQGTDNTVPRKGEYPPIIDDLISAIFC